MVVQNIFTSLFNSHIFDFHEGWMYVLGVRVGGGILLRASARRNESWCFLNALPAPSRAPIWAISSAGALSQSLGYLPSIGHRMTRLTHLTLHNYLIALHGVLATAAAFSPSICASMVARRSWCDCRSCSASCRFFGTQPRRLLPLQPTTTKWRFISLPDVLNIPRVATVQALALFVLDYIMIAPNVRGSFFGKVIIVLY